MSEATTTSQKQEENAAELQKRVEGFNAEMLPLLKKYRLGLGASAFLLPDGRIGARPILFDDTAKPADQPKDGAVASTTAEPEKLSEA